jgi:hypothetical protein
MDKIRAEKFEQLIEMLHEADALQQALLGDEDEAACYEFHSALNQMADEFELWAAVEEQETAQ